MPCHEIITVQVGNYSNYVGAHLFNIQQDYLDNPDFDPVVFWKQDQARSGGIRQVNWTPRALIFDLKQNWTCPYKLSKTASSSGAEREKVFQELERNVLWHGIVQRVGEAGEDDDKNGSLEKRRREADFKMKSTLNYAQVEGNSTSCAANMISSKLGEVGLDEQGTSGWNELVQWKLNAPNKSALMLPNFSTNFETGTISNFDQGQDIFSRIEDDALEGLRFYAEDCDFLQGFQFLVDQNDGFAGVSKGVLQLVSDEYNKKSCFAYGMSPADSELYKNEDGVSFRQRLSSTALCWNTFNSHCSVFTSLGLCRDLCKPTPTPISLPWINFQATSVIESSALLAATLDSLLLPCLLKGDSLGFSEMISLLNGYDHKMAVVGSAFPLSLLSRSNHETIERTLFQSLTEVGLDGILQSMTPGISMSSLINQDKCIGNFLVARGVSTQKVISKAEKELLRRQYGSRVENVDSALSCLQSYSQEICPKSVNIVRSVETPFRLSLPFPAHSFSPTYLQTQQKFRYQNLDFWKIPAMASAHNSTETGTLLEKLIEQVSPMKMKKSNFKFELSNIETDDYIECINDLEMLRDSYAKRSSL